MAYRSINRDWVWRHKPVEQHDKGANDEGYYYFYCYNCREKTEHETGCCCECDTQNDSDY